MRIFLLIILALASIWDAFTTVYGTIYVLGDGLLQIFAALLFSGLILGFVLNTKRIVRWRGGFVGGLIKFFWLIALFYDFFTSWIGNRNLLLPGESGAAELTILIGMTLLVTASPVLLSTLQQSSPVTREEPEPRAT
jgi:hypothetical protein